METTLRIQCELTPETMETRRAGLLPALAARAERCDDTADGYRLAFSASSDTLQAIISVVDAERECCRWLRFQLEVEADGGPITLTLSGPPGAREFLARLFES